MKYLYFIIAAAILSACSRGGDLQSSLEQYVAGQDCHIGIAVICGSDTFAVNGGESFPMMSVFKFPQAVAVADYCARNNIALEDSIAIDSAAMMPDTYSPMRERYGRVNLRLSTAELMEYSLVMSDNNACDILFSTTGSPAYADSLVKSLGFNDINIRHTEAEMHADTSLCALNSTTPLGMARFMDAFYKHIASTSPAMAVVKQNLEMCGTGTGRIPGAQFEEGTLIGHKTGTGDTDALGRLTAVNDVAYIELPDGKAYTIAVFVADSPKPIADTEAMIAAISEIVREHLSR